MQRLTPCKNINILPFVHLTVLNKLKALLLSTVGQSTIKHQHGKKVTWWIEASGTKNTWKMLIVFKSLFTKGVQNVYICTDTCLETVSSLVNCSVNNNLPKIGHTAIKHSFSILRTGNEQKAKCWYFAWCQSLHLFSWHLADICWIDDKKSHLKRVLRAWELQISDF